MLDTLFQSIIDSTTTITVWQYLLCLVFALALGGFLAFAYGFHGKSTKSFEVTLGLLPAAVSMVIMLVNGNLGAGVAVAGAFSLIRFRSSPGTARDIVAIFISMCVGLAIGMGYLGYATLFALVMGGILLGLNLAGVWGKRAYKEKVLRITIPEDLNYDEVFDDIFKEYTVKYEAASVKTTNMGSMYKLKYYVTLKDVSKEKQFIDELRCRNGNLEISLCNKEEFLNEEL